MSLRSQIESFTPLDKRELLDKSVILDCLDIFPDVLTRENRICHFTASAWIVNPEHTKALVIFHNLAKQWRWPGGHTDDLNVGFIFEASEDERFRIKPDENSDIRWMTFAEILQAVENGQMNDIYPKLIEKTKKQFS